MCSLFVGRTEIIEMVKDDERRLNLIDNLCSTNNTNSVGRTESIDESQTKAKNVNEFDNLCSTNRNNEYKYFYRRHLPHFQPEHATLFVTFRLAGTLLRKVLEKLKSDFYIQAQIIEKTTDGSERYDKLQVLWKKYFGKFDQLLHADSKGPIWLSNPEVADMTSEEIHFLDGKMYDLIAYCIMPNHVHLVILPLTKIVGQTESITELSVGRTKLRDELSDEVEDSYISGNPCSTNKVSEPLGRTEPFENQKNSEQASKLTDLFCSTYMTYATYKILQRLKWRTAFKANKILHRRGAFWQHESYDHVVRNQSECDRIVVYTLNNPVKAGLIQNWEDWKWNYVKTEL